MPVTTTLSDSDLLRKVRVELDWNPRIDAPDLSATVKDGIVTLSGFVDTYAKRIATVQAIHEISGVLDVVDEMEVRLPGRARADHDIAQAVRAALIWDVFVPDEHIQSTVSGGWVTLEGTVDRWQQREDAARCVERLSGVRGVTNRIDVKPPAVDAARLRKSIEDALTRRAEREARRISVTVDGGVVTLKGKVDSWAEKTALGCLATYSPGVQRLVNEIKVDPFT